MSHQRQTGMPVGGIEKKCGSGSGICLLPSLWYTKSFRLARLFWKGHGSSNKTHVSLGNSWPAAGADRILGSEAIPLTSHPTPELHFLHLGEFSVINGNSTVPKLGKPMAKREKNLLKRGGGIPHCAIILGCLGFSRSFRAQWACWVSWDFWGPPWLELSTLNTLNRTQPCFLYNQLALQ